MTRFEIVSHKGKQIVVVDLSNCLPDETLEALPLAQAAISKMPPYSALVLTDVTHATYNTAAAAAIKDFTDKNTPFVKKSAVVGADAVRLAVLQTVIMMTRRGIKACRTRQEALDWLVA